MKALLPLGNLSNRLWWRSEETVPGMSPYYGFITAINWKLNEVCGKEIFDIQEFSLHLLRFQQAGLIMLNVEWTNWDGDDSQENVEPLGKYVSCN